MKELALPSAFVFCPELEGAGGHFVVRLIGAIGAAHDARFAAGGCAGIARSPGVEECDACAAAAVFEEMEGGPAAEGSGADDCDVWFGFHDEEIEDISSAVFQGARTHEACANSRLLHFACPSLAEGHSENSWIRGSGLWSKSQASASKIVR